ncbi:carbohydrate-binding protein [Streptomyces sp. NPDC050704]|uniref:carbohydrate-binding protein n=1 Tax=Streptomyces sp. NPDC050704 TaxID=3157219 RepID=UPI00343B7142
MTPGNNGASTPEDDDPFGYLYEDGQAAGAQPPSGGGGYGYPGSVNRVRPVGERQYGQPAAPTAPTAQYGQQVPPQQAAYGRPNANYSAPETFPGGAPTTYQPLPANGGGGRGRGSNGPNTKGLLIGAVAVVAAVVIGIGVAMLGGDDEGDKGGDAAGAKPSGANSVQPSETASKAAGDPADLPKIDAKALRLEGGTTIDTQFDGAKAAGGVYVTGFNQVGAKVVWTVRDIGKAGSYRLDVRYGIPGVAADATLVVNGKANTAPLNMKNFIGEAGAPKGDWEKGWQTTWAPVTLNKGTNTIEVACNDGNKCDAVLDQLSLSKLK